MAVLDADKEGFLRSATSLIQICGRAARNVEGRVIMYADRVTDSMRQTIDEVERRRARQLAYNAERGIRPETIIKPIRDSIESLSDLDYVDLAPPPGRGTASRVAEDPALSWDAGRLRGEILKLGEEMRRAAAELRFEDAATLRDRLAELEALELSR